MPLRWNKRDSPLSNGNLGHTTLEESKRIFEPTPEGDLTLDYHLCHCECSKPTSKEIWVSFIRYYI